MTKEHEPKKIGRPEAGDKKKVTVRGKAMIKDILELGGGKQVYKMIGEFVKVEARKSRKRRARVERLKI